ncbi:MAG: 5-(carboxyamino)imidazole ribonucleotide synthase [Candidatus Levybacteria bacterium]|nr:5-(carboxyamino)imidazole ribonucleotide synthase [Candidatus Levybacteria bacterium]
MKYPIRIGIVGGGQLGKMLTIAAKKLGFYVTVIDPTIQSPAGQVADKQIIADYKDEKSIEELAQSSDFITFEIELANDSALFNILSRGKKVNPHPKTLSIIRDKLTQKNFLKENKIPTAKFKEVLSVNDIEKNAEEFGYPLMLKARTDAYDGRGNFLVRKKGDFKKGLEKLKGRKLYIEKFVPFIKELAIMVARGINEEIKSYPVVETIHKNNICDTVLVPGRVSLKIQKMAKKLAERTVSKLKGAGVFGIEMFLTKDNKILVNEIAPRVHNSGHFTIEASITSQFEQHIRAISGLPLGSTDLIPKAAVMKNILGENHGNGFPKGIEKALAISGVSLHIYGKKESRPQRKMGHITVMGNSIEECLNKANRARKVLII